MRKMRIFAAWLAMALIGVAFCSAVSGVDRKQAELGRSQLEDALRRAAVACYAAEGIYPADPVYLERYGVQIDDTHYIVHYEVFADNLMPDITVLDRK